MKSKLAFIDHSFHKKTKASDFLRDILIADFEIVDIWDESWMGKKPVTAKYINQQGFDYVLFFQSLTPITELRNIEAEIIWVPMYDDVIFHTKLFWLSLTILNVKIISFSKTLSERMRKINPEVLSLQYFLDPISFAATETSNEPNVFFWQRTNFGFNDVKKLLGNKQINQFILKLDTDPGYKEIEPSSNDIEKYSIKIIRGNLEKSDYMEMIRSSNVFIAPRKYEGIGMSFLEAMTLGLAVIATDNPTMNEYIIHNKTGFLFSSAKSIDISDFKIIGENARSYCENGFKEWEKDKNGIIPFIKNKHMQARNGNLFYCTKGFLYICFFPIEKSKLILKYLIS
jgi:hypothetical protein